jgi:hypothetical protein
VYVREEVLLARNLDAVEHVGTVADDRHRLAWKA